MELIHILFTLLVVAGTSGASSQCETSCSRSSWWKYQPGKIYRYSYNVESRTLMQGTSDQQSVFNLDADVEISPISPCTFVMQITHARLGSDRNEVVDSRELKDQLTAHSLEFGFDSGRVRTVCPSNRDPVWVMNMKKGILSAFQQSYDSPTNSETLIETDVTGECETTYTSTGLNWDKQTVRKDKKMSSCVNNQVLYQYALNIPDINIQHLPLLSSEYHCDITLDDGKLEKSTCKEQHLFKPFSNGNNGATSSVLQTLQLKEEAIGKLKSLPASETSKTDLRFIHNHERADDNADEEYVSSLLENYETIENSKISGLFNNLVYSLRNLEQVQLKRTYRKFQNSKKTKQFFLDALPILKTDAGVSLMKEIIISGDDDMTDEKIDSWFNSFMFYKNPTRAMISVLSSMLLEPRKSSVLGISSLISTFCSNTQNCTEYPEVQDALRILQSLLGNSCEASTHEQEDIIILALKGIRNIGSYYDDGEEIRQCFESNKNSYWIRLAALDATRKLPCEFSMKGKRMSNLLNDKQESSEVRIGAYLNLLDCPSDANIKAIKSLMENEPVNQVGSFIWTHLTNIQESKSKDKWKISLKNFIVSELMQNKWNTDPRKFSRNLEISHFLNDYRVGGSLDMNLIFSEESYIPRSGMINFTANIFGENINVLEIGGRIAGMEETVENIFGPQGYLKEDTIYKFVKSLRQKRDTNSELDEFADQFKTGMRENIPRGNIYMRQFGKDVYYNSFQGLKSLYDKSVTKPLQYFGFSSQKSNLEYSHSSMFLDGSIIVPTSAGLPLNLTVNGTSTVQFTSESQFDIKNLFSKGQAKMKTKIDPIINIEISALMSIDAYFLRTGLKSVTRLHSATYFDVNAEVNGGSLANFEVSIPHNKTEILEATADFFIYQGKQYKDLSTQQKQENLNSCSPSLISDTLGLQICAVGSYHHGSKTSTPQWYFAGPLKAEIFISKTDNFEKIVADYRWQTDDNRSSKGVMQNIHVVLDTPGSSVNRKSYFHIQYNNLRSYFLVDFTIPLRKSQIKFEYDWSTRRKILNALFRRLGSDVVNLHGQVDLYPRKYEGVMDLTFFDVPVMDWKGTFYNISNRYRIDATLNSQYHAPVYIKGNYRVKDRTIKHTTTIETSVLSADMAGMVYLTANGFKTESRINYNILERFTGKIIATNKYRDQQIGMRNKKDLSFYIKPSAYPQLETSIDWTIDSSIDYLKNRAEIAVGSEKWNFDQEFDSRANRKEQELIVKCSLTSLSKSVFYKFDFHHKMISGSISESYNKILIQISEDLLGEIYLKHKEIHFPYRFEAEGGVQLKESKMVLGANLYNPGVDDKTYLGGLYLYLPGGKDYVVHFSMERGNSQYLDYHIRSNATFSGMRPILLKGQIVYTDITATGDFILEYENTKYKASFHHDMMGNTKVDAQFELFGVNYKGEFDLKSNKEQMEFLIDLVGNRRIYITSMFLNDLSKISVKGYWDKDVDDSKSFQLKSVVLNGKFLSEIKIMGKTGKLELENDLNSFTGHLAWDKFHCTLAGTLQLESNHLEVMTSLQTSMPILREIKFHVLLASKALIHGRQLETKVEVKLNDYHHMAKFLHIKDTYRKIYLETISTFAPFDKLLVDLNLLLTWQKSTVDLKLKYHNVSVVVDSYHENRDNQIFDIVGKLEITSTITFLSHALLDFDFLLSTTNSLDCNAGITYKNSQILSATVNGTAFINKIDADFGVNLLKASRINLYEGNLKYVMKENTISTEVKIKNMGSNHHGKLDIYLSENFKVSGRLDSIGIVPLNSWFLYSSNSTSHLLQGEVRILQKQYLAVNLQHHNTEEGMKITTAVNILLRVYVFSFNLKPDKASLVFEDKMDNEIYNKVFLDLWKKETESKTISSSFKLIIMTKFKLLENIQIISRSYTTDKEQKIENKFYYSDYYLENRILSKFNNDDENVQKFSIESNFSNKTQYLMIKKTLQQTKTNILLTTKEDNYDYNLNLSMVVKENKKDILLQAFGNDGNWTLNGYVFKPNERHTELGVTFKDRKNLAFKLDASFMIQNASNHLKMSIISPFTDKLSIVVDIAVAERFYLKAQIFQPSFSYVNATISVLSSENSKDFKANIDVKNLLDVPIIIFQTSIALNETFKTLQKETAHFTGGKLNILMKFDENDIINIDSDVHVFNAGLKIHLNIDLFQLNSDTTIELLYQKDYVARVLCILNNVSNNIEIRILKNESKLHANIRGNLPYFKYEDFGVEFAVDAENYNVSFLLMKQKNYLDIGIKPFLSENVKTIEMSLNSSWVRWRTFNLSCKIDQSVNLATVHLHGASNDKSQLIEIDANIEKQQGHLSMIIELPFIGISGKQFNGSYSIDEEYSFDGNFSGDIVSAKLRSEENMIYYSFKSPFNGITDIRGYLEYRYTDDFSYIYVSTNNTLLTKSVYFKSEIDFREGLNINLAGSTNHEMLKFARIKVSVDKNSLELQTEYNDVQVIFICKPKSDFKNVHSVFSLKVGGKLYRTVANYSFDKQNEYTISFDGQILKQSTVFIFKLEKNELYVSANVPYVGEWKLYSSWSDYSIGLKLFTGETRILDVNLIKKIIKLSKVELSVAVKTLSDMMKEIELSIHIDADDIDTNFIDMTFKYNEYFIDVRFIFHANVDKFDGKIILKSSIDGWEDAVIKIHYDLGNETKVTVNLKRHEQEDFIAINIITEGYIRQVFNIVTPFQGYENITLTGMLRRDDFYEIQLKINYNIYFRMYIYFESLHENQLGDLKISLQYPSLISRNLELNMTYDVRSEVKLKASLSSNNDIFLLTITENALSNVLIVNLKTPYEKFEITGIFGSKEFSSYLTYGKGRSKREAALEFSAKNDNIKLNLATPLKKFSGINLLSKYHSDARQLTFSFHTFGRNRFGIELDYDLINFPQQGNISASLLIPKLDIDYNGLIEFELEKSNPDNFNGNFMFMRNGINLISGKIKRISGESKVHLQTPIDGWREVTVSLESDWHTNIAFALQRDKIISRIGLSKIDNRGFVLEILSPYEGYESIKTIVLIPHDDTKSIEILKNDETITKLELNFDLSLPKMKGTVDARWSAMDNTFITLHMSLNTMLSKIIVQTSFENFEYSKIELHTKAIEEVQIMNILVNVNNYFVYYNSSTIWTDSYIHSNSSIENNIPQLEFDHSHTSTNITFSTAFDAPFTLQFISFQDGIKTFDVFSSIILDFNAQGMKVVYKGEFPLQNGKIKARLDLKYDYSALLELVGNLDETKFEFTLKQDTGNAEAKFKSNLLNFEDIYGKAVWVINRGDSGEYGFDASMTYNSTKLVGISLWFSTKPLQEISIGILILDHIDESLDITISNSMDYGYKIDMNYIGFNNIDATFRIDARNYALKAIVENFSKQRRWELELQGLMKSKNPIQISFKLNLETPFSDKFKSSLFIDFTKIEKVVSAEFSYGSIYASSRTNVIWTSNQQKIHVSVACPTLNLKQVSVSILKESHEFLKFEGTLNEKSLRMEIINKIVSDSFLVGIDLSLPVSGYEKLVFFGKGKANPFSSSKESDGYFILETMNRKYDMKYEVKDTNLTINVRTPITFANNIDILANFKSPNLYEVKIHWNQQSFKFYYNLNLPVSNIEIHFESSLQYLKEFRSVFSLQPNKVVLIGKLDGSLIVSNLNISCVQSSNKTLLEFRLEKNNSSAFGQVMAIFKEEEIIVNLILNYDSNEILNVECNAKQSNKIVDFNVNIMFPNFEVSNILIKVSTNKSINQKTGFFELSYNGTITNIECGKLEDNMYLKVRSPSTKLTMTMNVDNKDVFAVMVTSIGKMSANFTNIDNIQMFIVTADIDSDNFICSGKIDFSKLAIETNFQRSSSDLHAQQESHMKLEFKKNKLKVSLKTPTFALKNVLLQGNWQSIEDGFAANFSTEVNDVSYQFESIFKTATDETSGFWKIIDQSEKEIMFFELCISEVPDGADMMVKLNTIWDINATLRLNYILNENKIDCGLQLLSTNLPRISNLTIKYTLEYNSILDLRMRTNVLSPDLVLSFDQEFRMLSLNDITIRSYNEIPQYSKILNIEFIFRPTSIHDFEFSSKLQTSDSNIGGSISYKQEGNTIDIVLSVFFGKFSKAYKMGGKFEYPDPFGEVIVYFNDSNWNSFIDLDKAHFTLRSCLDLKSLSQSTDFSLTKKNNRLLVEKIVMNMTFEKHKALDLNITAEGSGYTSVIFYSDGYQLSGQMNITYPQHNLQKFGELQIKYGQIGSIAITLKDFDEFLQFEIEESPGSKVRKTRAVIESPSIGQISYYSHHKFMQGAIIILASDGLHKMIYDIKETDGYDVSVTIESPLIDDGTALITMNLNEEMNHLRGTLNLNNKHFLSLSLKFLPMNFELNSSFESKDSVMFPSSSSLKLKAHKVNDIYKLSIDLDYKTKHNAIISFTNQARKEFNLYASSNWISNNPVAMKITLLPSWKASEIDVEISYKKEKILLKFSHTYNNIFNFDGKLSLSISQLKLYNVKVYFQINLKSSNLLKLLVQDEEKKIEVTTTIDKANAIITTIETPFDRMEKARIIVRNEHNKDFSEGILDVEVYTLSGVILYNSLWEISINSIHIQSKISFPSGKSFFQTLKLDYETGIIWHSYLPYFGLLDMEMILTKVSENKLLDCIVYGNLKVLDNEYTMKLGLTYKNSYEISLEVETPHDKFQHQKFNIGFSNSNERKMGKFSVNCYYLKTGIGVDFLYTGWKDMSAELFIDFPHPNWSDFGFHIANQMNASEKFILVSGNISDNLSKIKFHLTNSMMEAELRFFKYIFTMLQVGMKTSSQFNFKIFKSRLSLNKESYTISSKFYQNKSDVGGILEANQNNMNVVRLMRLQEIGKNVIKISGLSNDFELDVENVYDTCLLIKGSRDTGVYGLIVNKFNVFNYQFSNISFIMRNSGEGFDGVLYNSNMDKFRTFYFWFHSTGPLQSFTLKALDKDNILVLDTSLTKYVIKTNSVSEDITLVLINPYTNIKIRSKSNYKEKEIQRQLSIIYDIGTLTEHGLVIRYHNQVDNRNENIYSIDFFGNLNSKFKGLEMRTSQESKEIMMNLQILAEEPQDEIKIKALLQMERKQEILELLTNIDYEIGNYEPNTIKTKLIYDPHSNQVDASIESRGAKLDAKLKARQSEDTDALSFFLYFNGIKKISAMYDYNRLKERANLDMFVIGDVSVNLFAGFESRSDMSFKMSHSYRGSSTEDTKFQISLIEGQQFVTTMRWRKGMMKDILSYAKWIHYKYNIDTFDINLQSEDAIDIIHRFFMKTTNLILLGPISLDIHEMKADARNSVELLRKFLEQYRHSNKQLVNYIIESLINFIDDSLDLLHNLANAWINIRRIIESLVDDIFTKLKSVIEKTNELKKLAKQRLKYLDEHLDEYLEIMFEKIGHILDLAKQKINKLILAYKKYTSSYSAGPRKILIEFANQFKKDIISFLHMYAQIMDSYEAGHQALEILTDLKEWLDFFQIIDQIKMIYDRMQRSLVNSWKLAKKLYERSLELSDKIMTIYLHTVQRLMRYPPLRNAMDICIKWFTITKNILTFLFKDIQIRRMVDSLLARANIFTSIMFRVADFLINKREIFAYSLVYTPESGFIQYSQSLPINWYEFNEIPKILNIFSQTESAPWDVTDFYLKARDAIRDFLGMIRSKSIFPPFSGTAMVLGNNHILTFDGKIYDFGGKCSYLLVSDLIHRKFSVVIQYNQNGRRSFFVYVDKKKIKLDNDGRVFIDERRHELPLSIEGSFITRNGNRLRLHNRQGFLVDLNLAQNLCTVRLSGWYFGSTGGLFGSFDNEPSNDWMLPDHKISSDLDEFTNSWQFNQTGCSEGYKPATYSNITWDQEKCYNLFINRDSDLRPCFGTVDPEPFYEVCLREMKLSTKDFRKGFCQASMAYVENCRKHGSSLDYPLECVTCNVPGNAQLPGGHNVRYTSKATSGVDVLFLVEQTQCNKRLNFTRVLTSLDISLNNQGLIDNKYTLVGYGGPGKYESPLIYTAYNQLFSDAEKLQMSFDRLNFDGAGVESMLEPLEFALRMTMRPAISKIMFVFNCEAVYDSKVYKEISVILRDNDIRLHYVSPVQLYLNTTRPHGEVMGFTEDTILTSQSVVGGSRLRRYLRKPLRNTLADLATSTGGVIFSSRFLSSESQKNVKIASTALAAQVATQAHPTDCQLCDCMVDDEGEGKVLCQRCITPSFDFITFQWNKFGAKMPTG